MYQWLSQLNKNITCRQAILIISSLLMLANNNVVQADWLGEMQSGNAIDLPGTASQEMALEFDEDNNGLAVFTQQTTSFYNLLPSTQTYGGTLWVTNDIPINNTILVGVGDVRDPQMDLIDSGTGLCVYSQYTSGRFRIFGARYNNGFSAINNSNPLDTPIGFNAEQPTMVQMDDNSSLITYLQNNNTNNRIFASRWDGTSRTFWGPTGWTDIGLGLEIDGTEPVNSSRPHLAVSTTGEVFCVYAKEGTSKKIYASVYRNQQWYYWGIGGWIAAGTINNSVAISINDPNLDSDRPKITALPNGEMLCVYEVNSQITGISRIHSTCYDGQTWIPADENAMVDSIATTVNATSADIAASPQLNKVICVYAKGDTGTAVGQHVFASEWDGSGWQVMNQGIAIDSRGNSVTPITPKISFDHRGNAIALYQQWDNNKTNMFANYFQGPPFVDTISPDSGNNNAITTVAVIGYNFAGGSTVGTKVSARLRQAGQNDIIGTNVLVATPTGNIFTAVAFSVDFDLNGAHVGDWDLVVENPDGQYYIKPSVFGVTWPDLEQAYAYPNPIKLQGTGPQAASAIRFHNLVRAVKVRIYTVKGEWVRTIEKDDSQLYVEWDLRNEANHLVAPGIYLYRIDSTEGSVYSGKCMVIR